MLYHLISFLGLGFKYMNFRGTQTFRLSTWSTKKESERQRERELDDKFLQKGTEFSFPMPHATQGQETQFSNFQFQEPAT